MSGRRTEDERSEILQGEVLRGGGVESAGIGVGAADSDGASGSAPAGSASEPASAAVVAPAVAVSVPGFGGSAPTDASEDSAESAGAGSMLAEPPAAAAPPLDSAARLNAGRVSPRGVDRGGHVHRVDVPKTPAQGGDRDVLSAEAAGASNADTGELDDRAEDEGESAPVADLSGPQLVGRRLMLARRHAGLSVEEVAASTRIRGTMIRQIEAGDFSRCGGDVYARGHVRTLAKVAGVDAEVILDGQAALVVAEQAAQRPSPSAPMFAPQAKAKEKAAKEKAHQDKGSRGKASKDDAGKDEAGGVEAPARGARVVRPAKAAPPAVAEPRRKEKNGVIGRAAKSPNWTAAMLVVLLGLVVFGGMQLIGEDDSAPAAAAHVPPPKPKPAPVPAPAPAPAPTGVAVKIAATGAESWLAVFSSDGKKLFDNLLSAGSSITFVDGHKLDVTVGNAGAIRMQLNGKDVAPSGGSGEVLHYAVNPTGVVAG